MPSACAGPPSPDRPGTALAPPWVLPPPPQDVAGGQEGGQEATALNAVENSGGSTATSPLFGGFVRSRTRASLVDGRASLEPLMRCPYCGAPVWSITAAGLAPCSACRRLIAREGRLEYFVCVSGHLHGSCWLARLSSSRCS